MNIVIDNFFKDPDKIRKYGLSLNYVNHENYPGTRAFVEDDTLNQQIQEKILNAIIDLQSQEVKWSTNLYFQKTSKNNKGGWIHQDPQSYITCVIYLSPDAKLEEGTSIYKEKSLPLSYSDNARLNSFKNNYSNDKEEIDRKKWNSQFQETLKVDNLYNRLFMFSGSQWHGVPKFKTDRLTLIYFVHMIQCKSLPLTRLEEYNL